MRKSKLLIALAICLGPSTGYAGTGLSNPAYLPRDFTDIHLAQSGADKLSDSDLKRINFYSDRVLKSLAALAAEDAAGAVDSDASVVALRTAISRLVDAGKRSGMTQVETADFFQLLTEDKFLQGVPLALQDASGKIDTRVLFSGVTGRSPFGTSGKSTQDYLQQLDAASAKLAPLSGTAKPDNSPVQTAETSPQKLEIQIPEGADSATREILQRVEFHNGRWVIAVTDGDTLARFATALYGDPLAYRQIFLVNETVLSSPHDLTVGDVLELPKSE